MKQLLLALALIAAPVSLFSAGYHYLGKSGELASSAVPDSSNLGDLSKLKGIIEDVQSLAKTGDMVAAEKRITDFETSWDDAQDAMRPLNPIAWGVVDDAADAALHALRASAPVPDTVNATLAGLLAILENPVQTSSSDGVAKLVAGIAVTDATGHALPCEEMLKDLRTAIADGSILEAQKTEASKLEVKATERCNADDDARSDAFSAEGLALIAK